MYLLAAPPSSFNSIVFQTHLGLLNGAVLALIFPVLDTYTMPGEVRTRLSFVKRLSLYEGKVKKTFPIKRLSLYFHQGKTR